MTTNEQARHFREESYRARQYKLKTGSNRFLYTFLAVFVCGYAFFFSSTLWLPESYVGVDVTPIGEVVSENDREIVIDSWEYSPEEKVMEVLLEIRSLAVDEIDDYRFQVRGKEGRYSTNTTLHKDDLYVLRVSDVPEDWTELSLTIEADGKDGEQNRNFNPVVIYSNDKIVAKVPHIEEKTLADYQRKSIDQRIENYQKTIQQTYRRNQKIDGDIAAANRKIRKIKEEMGYQTPSEVEASEEAVEALEQRKKDLQANREENSKLIEEYENKISLQKQKRKELQSVSSGSRSMQKIVTSGGEK